MKHYCLGAYVLISQQTHIRTVVLVSIMISCIDIAANNNDRLKASYLYNFHNQCIKTAIKIRG